jgi:hypothetical protein
VTAWSEPDTSFVACRDSSPRCCSANSSKPNSPAGNAPLIQDEPT